MTIFSPEFFSALVAIVVIDLVLAGDNAIVIALVARSLPSHLQRMTIIGGTIGAVVVRLAITLAIVWLLHIPGLLITGGILLIWIACKLLAPEQDKKSVAHSAPSGTGLWPAIRTIIMADAVMGIDNVLGVAGAAQGEFLLAALGLVISIPIMILGSTIILKWVERYPVIIYIGATVLAWTAAKMIVQEPFVSELIGQSKFIIWALYVLTIGGVLSYGLIRKTPFRASPTKKMPHVEETSREALNLNRSGGD